jgi:hypothetical protein
MDHPFDIITDTEDKLWYEINSNRQGPFNNIVELHEHLGKYLEDLREKTVMKKVEFFRPIDIKPLSTMNKKDFVYIHYKEKLFNIFGQKIVPFCPICDYKIKNILLYLYL